MLVKYGRGGGLPQPAHNRLAVLLIQVISGTGNCYETDTRYFFFPAERSKSFSVASLIIISPGHLFLCLKTIAQGHPGSAGARNGYPRSPRDRRRVAYCTHANGPGTPPIKASTRLFSLTPKPVFRWY